MAEAFLTTAKAAMAGQLQGSLRAVPAVPGKLVFAFFNTTLGTSCHAAGVDQVSLQGHRGQTSDSQQLNLGGICPKVAKHLFSCALPSLQNHDRVSTSNMLLTSQITSQINLGRNLSLREVM